MRKHVLLSVALGIATAVTGGSLAVSSAAAATPPAMHTQATAVGPSVWAKVSGNGALLAGSGVTSINKFGRGRYDLTTAVDVTNCALTGTVDTNGGSDPGPGSSSILVGLVNGNTLFVRTATPSAASPANVDDDRPFSLAVFCN